jgi:hypothetical protein
MEEQLVGGVANAGSVVRVGNEVLRPSNQHSRAIHRFLRGNQADCPGRLRLVADTYGLDDEGRIALISLLDDSIRHGGEFVRRRVEAGDPNFVAMWNEMGGAERFDRRRHWWAKHRDHFMKALQDG